MHCAGAAVDLAAICRGAPEGLFVLPDGVAVSDEGLGSWPTGPSHGADAVLVVHDDGTATGITPPAAHLSGGRPAAACRHC